MNDYKYWMRTDIEPPENKTLLLELCFIDERKIGYEEIYTGHYNKEYGYFVNSIDNAINNITSCFKWGRHSQVNIGLGDDRIKIEGYKIL